MMQRDVMNEVLVGINHSEVQFIEEKSDKLLCEPLLGVPIENLAQSKTYLGMKDPSKELIDYFRDELQQGGDCG